MNPKVLLSLFLIGIMVDFTVSRYARVGYDFPRKPPPHNDFPRRFIEDNFHKRSLHPFQIKIDRCMEELKSLPDAAAEYLCTVINIPNSEIAE